MQTQSKTELEKKKTSIRASRITLLILLVIEAFILLMHFPGFLGVDWLENGLIAVRTFLVELLWPSDAADMVTYRGTIYEICTWFQKLPIYPLLVQVIIYLVPGLLILSFIRIRILDWRIKLIENPELAQRTRKPRTPRQPKEPKEPKPHSDSSMLQGLITESGLTPQEAKEADQYCEDHRELEQGADPFSAEPGIRVQRLTGEIGLGESRDFVIPWNANGEVDLTAILRRPVKLKLEQGRPYIYTKNQHHQVMRGETPMRRFDPMGFAVRAEEGNPVICVITWLGG